MTLPALLLLLLIAAACGAIGEAIAGYSVGGCLVSAGIGFIGALLGSWISRSLGFPEIFVVHVGEVAYPVFWSIVGSGTLIALAGILRTGRRR